MYYIIFTIGRTGSSLLVNVLNQFDGVTFSGEIYNLGLFDKMNQGKDITLGLFGIFSNKGNLIKGRLKNSPIYMPPSTNYRKYFRKPGKFSKEYHELKTLEEKMEFIMPKDKKIVGCKMLANAKNFRWFLTFKKIVPMFKVIILIREDTEALRDSMRRAGWGGWKRIDLEKENREYNEIYEENKGRMYLVSYEDMKMRNKRWKGLFKYLGIKYDGEKVNRGFRMVCSYASSIIK